MSILLRNAKSEGKATIIVVWASGDNIVVKQTEIDVKDNIIGE